MPSQFDPSDGGRAYYSGAEEEEFLREERRRLNSAHAARNGPAGANAPWTGICVSGGGIRSATFALGVFQALAATGLLRRFDYISSVSGGSYIAASLQWWWCRNRMEHDKAIQLQEPEFGLTRKDFPYGVGEIQSAIDKQQAAFSGADGTTTQIVATTKSAGTKIANSDTKPPGENCKEEHKADGDTDDQTLVLSFLRNHGNYLAPDDGIGIWSGLAVVIRTVLLSLLIWVPLLIFVFLAIDVVNDLVLNPIVASLATAMGGSINNLPSPIGGIPNNWVADPQCGRTDQPACAFAWRLAYAIPVWISAGFAGLFILLSLIFGLLSRSPQDVSGPPKLSLRVVFPFFGAIALLGGTVRYLTQNQPALDSRLVIGIGLLIGITLLFRFASEVLRGRSLNASYWSRRFLERYFQKTFLPSLVILVIGLMPFVPYYVAHFAKKAEADAIALSVASFGAGAITLVGGVASSLYAYYAIIRKWNPGIASSIFVPLGAGLYLYGSMVLAYVLAAVVFESLNGPESTLIIGMAGTRDVGSVRLAIQAASLFAIIVAFALGLTANVNLVGLHRFYRDRLMEAFLPSWSAVRRGRADYSPVADRLLLPDLVDSVGASSGKTNACPAPYPLINAIAIMTNDVDRRISGRGGTNFILSPLFTGSSVTGWEAADLHVARFGPLTLASAMAASGAAVNANAGYIGTGVTRGRLISAAMTLLNMRLGIWAGNPGNQRHRGKGVPTFFRPVLTLGLFGSGHRRSSRFLELADGGNFENLGLYELVRRKLGLIVVVDGEEDPSLALPALVSAVERIGEDFKATISFADGRGPERFILGPSGPDYPTGIRFAQSPFMLGEITYDDGKTGVLIYIKATMIRGLRFTTSGYWASNQSFPHQTTINQFFVSEQFEAYRDLGFKSTMVMNEALELSETFDDHTRLRANYTSDTASDDIT